MNVHQRIKEFREARKLTYQQFADGVGVTRGAVQQWEKGDTAPNRKKQPSVAKFMGLTVEQLMHEGETAPIKPALNVTQVLINSGKPALHLADALQVLASHLATTNHPDAVASLLTALVKAPGDIKTLSALQTMLTPFVEQERSQA